LRKRRRNLREVSFPLWERQRNPRKVKMADKNIEDKENSDVKGNRLLKQKESSGKIWKNKRNLRRKAVCAKVKQKQEQKESQAKPREMRSEKWPLWSKDSSEV